MSQDSTDFTDKLKEPSDTEPKEVIQTRVGVEDRSGLNIWSTLGTAAEFVTTVSYSSRQFTHMRCHMALQMGLILKKCRETLM